VEAQRAERRAIVLVHDPEAQPAVMADVLEQGLRLPKGAARLVAALAADDDLKSYAEREGVTIHTARFHLRAAGARTGARTQAELVRLAVRILRDFALAEPKPRFTAPKIELNSSPDIWLAELALAIGSPSHKLFALEALFEAAHSDEAIRRLRDRVGSVDMFGVHEMRRRDVRIGELENLTGSLNESLQQMTSSRSWRWTAPFLAMKEALRRR
jgi:hypothetical protein